MATPFDPFILGATDAETTALILQLQLEDNAELLRQFQGHDQDVTGADRDAEIALRFYQEQLECTKSMFLDVEAAKRIADGEEPDHEGNIVLPVREIFEIEVGAGVGVEVEDGSAMIGECQTSFGLLGEMEADGKVIEVGEGSILNSWANASGSIDDAVARENAAV